MRLPSNEKSCAENHAREERWQRQMQAAQDSDKAACHALLMGIAPPHTRCGAAQMAQPPRRRGGICVTH